MARNARWAIRLIAMAVVMGCGCYSAPVWAQNTVTVDPALQYQTLEGWGTSLCWFANVLGGAPDSIRNHYADLIFDPVKGLGLNVVRYNIGGGENPAYHFLQYRARVPGYEPTQGHYEWKQDANQRWFLQAAMARGADQQEAFSNSPPYWMTHSGSVTGSTNGTSDNLNPAYYTAFADYLSTVVQHFQTAWGVTFRTVEPLNEPIAGWWKFGGGQEGCHFDRSTQNTTVKNLGAALADKGLLTGVAASDENSIDDAVLSLQALDTNAISYLMKANTHSYGGSRRLGLWTLSESAGKSHWMSEYGDRDATGLTMSEQILSDMQRMHPSAWVYWQAVDNISSGGWGMLASNLNNPTDYSYLTNEKYYVMAQYSNFIRPGYQFLFSNDSQSLAAYSQATQTLVLVTTNTTGTDRKISFNLSGFNSVTGPVTPYRTSATENLAQLNPIPVTQGRKFAGIAAADSVTTFVIPGANYTPSISATINDNTIGAGNNRFSYTGPWSYGTQSGAYEGDDHWSDTPNAFYSVQFYGTQIRLYASTGPNHGIAAMSIDGGAENENDLYAPTRSDNVFLYASPTLPSGPHTLQVRVTGRKNPAATDCLIYADRADIAKGQPLYSSTGLYELVNRNSGDVMDVDGASTAAGAQLIQWPDHNGSNQQWRILPVSGGYFNLVNSNSGLCLDIAGASTQGGADAVQEPADRTADQEWKIAFETGPFYKLIDRNSGLVLNTNGASLADGADLIQWSDNGGYNTQWMILRVR